MTDVRLSATTPDGEVVPVLANAKGELLLEEPIAPPPFDGNLDGDLTVSGSTVANGDLKKYAGASLKFAVLDDSVRLFESPQTYADWTINLKTDGSADFIGSITGAAATFNGDVVIGSRGSNWLIRESNGVAMLVEQTRRDIKTSLIEEVRDLPRELDLVEAALNEIMDKLKMTPPSGWPVWDGSDNSQ